MSHIFASFKESLSSVLPIAIIVLILSVTCVSLDAGVLVLFLFGTILLILGMAFFTVGSGISMEPLGDGIGKSLGKSSKIFFPLIICFILGFIIKPMRKNNELMLKGLNPKFLIKESKTILKQIKKGK